MRKIIFRADASVAIGYGHFIRTLALADMLKNDFECHFATVKPTEYQIHEIERICKCVYLPDGDAHFDFFLSFLQGDEIVVLDNYFFTTEYHLKIKSKGCVLVCIDDLHDKHYVADIVINHSLTNPSLFSIEPYTKLCIGLEWALLRKPFLQHQKRKKERNIGENKIVICFGGVDSNNFTEKVINALIVVSSVKEIVAIVGDGYVGSEKYPANVKLEYNLSAEKIASLFLSADYAFLSASTICIEALACSVPIAAGYYVDNQKEFYSVLNDSRSIYPLGNLFDVDWDAEVKVALSENYKSKVNISSEIVVNYIKLFQKITIFRNYIENDLVFIDYRNLTNEQHEFIWRIRNLDEIRCRMDNSNKFSLQDHYLFVKNLEKTRTKFYWCVYQNGKIIGSVNLHIDEKLSDEGERGIFILPELIGKSIGQNIDFAVEKICKKMGLTKIKAKVLKNNQRSLHYHLKISYVKIKEDSEYVYFIKELNG